MVTYHMRQSLVRVPSLSSHLVKALWQLAQQEVMALLTHLQQTLIDM